MNIKSEIEFGTRTAALFGRAAAAENPANAVGVWNRRGRAFTRNEGISRPFRRMQKMKTTISQQRRRELEEEVARLHEMLQHEEKVHEVLESALLLNGIPSVLHIPSFLPKKAKKLLAELIMLEEEIARLEGEISKVQQNIAEESHSQKLKRIDTYKRKIASVVTSSNKPSTSPTQISRNYEFEEKMTFETKPMFFINQAIKGAYTNHGFASNGNSIERPPSPKRPPRHPSPRESDSNMETLHKLLHGPALSASPLDTNSQKWQPNKLSEKILSCLICIFLRLMRTARATELEKAGNVSKSNNSSLRTRSFRMEDGLSINSSLSTHKEAGQKDPYGIFEIEGSLLRDVGPYKNLVRFTSSSLELKGISSCLLMLNNLRRVSQLGFYTFGIYGVLEHGLSSNPEENTGLWNKTVMNIGGIKLNALAIEYFILRKASNYRETYPKSVVDSKDGSILKFYCLERAEPNLQFALCYGNRSSPAVKIYTADSVSAELEKSKLEYLQASIVVTVSRRMMIPKLLFSSISDIKAASLESLLEWICNQLPTSGALRKSIVDCVGGQNNRKLSEIVDIMPCEYDFQYLLPM
ncbi:hypothetical protein KSP40_PGU002095 [Platanthera guangdongensis]|uniref:Ternary complex factor MIP1 leucine-zipper domain-containing protein n=1 Tax=Platanthera guangdongensis TaxID=2320717 RepID=A0ABR2MP64_9ASPA